MYHCSCPSKVSCCQHALWGFKHPSTTIKLNTNKGIRTSDDNTTLRLHCAHRGGALVCKHHVSGAAAAARKMHRTETVLHFYCHSCKVFRHKHASSDFKQPSDSLPSTNPISSTPSRPNTKLSARLTAGSSKGACCSDIALNPCLCHPSYVFRHCYSSGSFRHPSNRCASSKLSCSAFSRPNVEFSAFPNSSICCKQSHEFTKAGAQCSLGVCAYPIRTRLLAVHLASSADSTPRSDAGVARRCIFASQGSSCICTVPTVPSNDNEIGSLRVRHRPSTDRSTSHAEANIPDSPMRVKCGPGRVGILPVVGDSCLTTHS